MVYRVIGPDTKRVHISMNLHFFKNKYWDWANSATSFCVPFADKDKNQVIESPPLEAADQQSEIHHLPNSPSQQAQRTPPTTAELR